jgi:hypothetical protein
MGQLIEDRVQRSRNVYRRHAWHEAFDLLRQVDSETPASPSGSQDFPTFYKRHFGVFRFRQRRRRRRWPARHERLPEVQCRGELLAAGVKTEVLIVLDVLVMVSPETADRKGGYLD